MDKSIKVFITPLVIISLLIFGFTIYLNTKPSTQEGVANEQNKNYEPASTPSSSKGIDESTNMSDTTPEILTYKKGLFSWIPNTIMDNRRDDLLEIINILEINELYQYFEITEANADEANEFAKILHEKDVDLYILAGASDWTYRPDGQPMLNEIYRAIALRDEWGEDSIKGIVYDIEPYDSQKWINGKQDVLMQNYISGMKAAYEEAKEQELRVVICIPAWYDTDHNDTLLELVKYCDELSVMNYNRSNEFENIINEINLANNYDKDITCIFEFQAVGKHNLTDEQTYYNYGVDAALMSFEHIYTKAGYSNLKFAYHYLEPLKELLLQD